jgi:hypothetical protein
MLILNLKESEEIKNLKEKMDVDQPERYSLRKRPIKSGKFLSPLSSLPHILIPSGFM